MTESLSDPLTRALCSLEGLSVGDAFGERYFVTDAEEVIDARYLPRPPWRFTDDTQMALSIVSVLRQSGRIDQDQLGTDFSAHYDNTRGYGPAMHQLVPMIWLPGSWRMMAPRLFQGQGSFGNGAAMRVAPIGAYFADDLQASASNAALSAEVTHAHPEAIAGAMAVAVAASLACRLRGAGTLPMPAEFIEAILPFVPAGLVRDGIESARDLHPDASVNAAVATLGNGDGVSAQDTVPFVLWCAAKHLISYEEALWLTVSGLGDRDTTCAIVGGIVACCTGLEGIPDAWRQAREPLPDWHLR
jgi:ADP-ribosylglycohydrolase